MAWFGARSRSARGLPGKASLYDTGQILIREYHPGAKLSGEFQGLNHDWMEDRGGRGFSYFGDFTIYHDPDNPERTSCEIPEPGAGGD